MRRAFQNTMRDDLVGAVERLTGRTVEAFLSDNLHEPDVGRHLPADAGPRRRQRQGAAHGLTGALAAAAA